MSKEQLLKKINKLYEEMKTIYYLKELKKYYYADLCFYLGMEYIIKSIKLIKEDME